MDDVAEQILFQIEDRDEDGLLYSSIGDDISASEEAHTIETLFSTNMNNEDEKDTLDSIMDDAITSATLAPKRVSRIQQRSFEGD